jgi:hypothetical protein
LENLSIPLIFLVSWGCHVPDNVEELESQLQSSMELFDLLISLLVFRNFRVEWGIHELKILELEGRPNVGNVYVVRDLVDK